MQAQRASFLCTLYLPCSVTPSNIKRLIGEEIAPVSQITFSAAFNVDARFLLNELNLVEVDGFAEIPLELPLGTAVWLMMKKTLPLFVVAHLHVTL